jgi:hypothetical protein
MRRLAGLTLLVAATTPFARAQSLYVGMGGGYTRMGAQNIFAVRMNDMISPWRMDVDVVDGAKVEEGWELLFTAKYDVPEFPLRLTGAIAYARLHGTNDSVIATEPPWSSALYNAGRLETNLSLVSLSAGVEWDVVKGPVAPFLALNALFNRFSESDLKIANPYRQRVWMSEAVERGGLALGGGIRALHFRPLIVGLEMYYTAQNLIGRLDGESNRNGFIVRGMLLYEVR